MAESTCYSSCTRNTARAVKARCMPLATTRWKRQHGVCGVSRTTRLRTDTARQNTQCRVAKRSSATSGFLSYLRSTAGARPGSRLRLFSGLCRYGKACHGATVARRPYRDTWIPHGGMRRGPGAVGTTQENPGNFSLSHQGPGAGSNRRSVSLDLAQTRESLGAAKCD